ncbi:hypothetical protein GCM10010521_50250 [Streptomyces rameus]|uniref:Uncharacterized protein n=1 Tax=Streptomyces rameus TaxID=68261 RepID=A0ABP6NT62_9ACTN
MRLPHLGVAIALGPQQCGGRYGTGRGAGGDFGGGEAALVRWMPLFGSVMREATAPTMVTSSPRVRCIRHVVGTVTASGPCPYARTNRRRPKECERPPRGTGSEPRHGTLRLSVAADGRLEGLRLCGHPDRAAACSGSGGSGRLAPAVRGPRPGRSSAVAPLDLPGRGRGQAARRLSYLWTTAHPWRTVDDRQRNTHP